MVITEFKILGVLPSVNACIRREKSYEETKELLRGILSKNYEGFKPLNFPVRVVIYHYLKEESYNKDDIDNKQKIIQDAMNKIIIEDDVLIHAIYSEKRIAKSTEYFTVLIEEFNETKNDNSGEIIGVIDDTKEKIMKAKDSQLAIKNKKISELTELIEREEDIKHGLKKELQDKTSELIGIKKVLEAKEKGLAAKSNSISSHIKDKEKLRQENKMLLDEIGKLQKIIAENDIKIEAEEEAAEDRLLKNFDLYNEKSIKIEKYISNKASGEFLKELVSDFEKDSKLLKTKFKNRISCDKIKKMMKEIFGVGLMTEGEYLILNNRENRTG